MPPTIVSSKLVRSTASSNDAIAWGLNTTGWIVVVTVSAGLMLILIIAVVVQACLLCRVRRQAPKYSGTYDVAFAHMDPNYAALSDSHLHIMPMTSTRPAEAGPSYSTSSANTTTDTDGDHPVVAGRGDHTPPDGRSQNSIDTTASNNGHEDAQRGKKTDSAFDNELQQQSLKQNNSEHMTSVVVHEDQSAQARLNPMHMHHMAYYDAIP